jgi:hypothetical protein
VHIVVAVLELLTLKLETMTEKSTEHQESTNPPLLMASVMPRFKVHYAPYGEWGGELVNCGKYYTTDVAHTGNRDKVTCKFCQRLASI